MVRLFLTLAVFLTLSLYVNCYAQSHLGKSRAELIELAETNYPRGTTSYVNDAEEPYLQIQNGYETLFYYFEDEVCVKFQVLKPYTCNCLEQDIEAYQRNCIALGNLKWMSKDMTKLYEMTLKQEYYSLSIVPQQADLQAEDAQVDYDMAVH